MSDANVLKGELIPGATFFMFLFSLQTFFFPNWPMFSLW